MKNRIATARVYRAMIKTPDGYREEEIEWDAILKDLGSLHPSLATYDKTIFAPATVPDGGQLLGMHTPIDTQGWTELLTDADTVEDLLTSPAVDDDEDDEDAEAAGAPSARFARSAVVLPLEMPGYFAIAFSGAGRGPGPGKLKTFLNAVQKPNDAADKWEIRPVMDHSRLEEFLGAGRATAFQTEFPVDHDLLALMPDEDGSRHGSLFQMGRQIAEATGVSVIVDVTISSAPESADNVAAQQAIAREAQKDPELLLRRESGAHAVTVMPSGEVVDLNLVPDAMARSFDLNVEGGELLTFRHTCQGMVDLLDTLNADVAARHNGD
ncbi:hypothetical protein [Micrococcus luteus]|uniref:hypothetical protein n=1 Tax=Micrococcus luteus TaxID=1270 RepID=UPI0020CEF2E9|nr:hypothetical protein [Micrococcus luteus]UTT46496.1 hypothetical protein NMQ02_04570 [Micrococcus luteus]